MVGLLSLWHIPHFHSQFYSSTFKAVLWSGVVMSTKSPVLYHYNEEKKHFFSIALTPFYILTLRIIVYTYQYPKISKNLGDNKIFIYSHIKRDS